MALVDTRDVKSLLDFIVESNRIEGILRDPHPQEIDAHAAFLALDAIGIGDLEVFVREVAATDLRRRAGQDVRVGRHFPPPGGPEIEADLIALVAMANTASADPYAVHCDYELLHPFMDGNGRSGRVLWAWMMRRQGLDPFSLPFLHRFYYQSLDAAREG